MTAIFLDSIGGLLALIAIVALVVVLQEYRKRRRRAALVKVAEKIGLRYEGDGWSRTEEGPSLETSLFDRGHSGEFRNVMTGHASGLKVSLFDYTFTTGVGRTSTDKTQTIAAFEKNGIQMPEFALQSEGMLQKVGDAFSQKDIDFESHPEFSNRFQLRSSQEGRTRRVFTRSLLDFLTDVELGEVWRIEGVDATLLIYGRNKQVKPEDYPAFFRESSFLATEFFKRCGANKPG